MGGQRLHTMLEAQFRDAGANLKDLDHDACEALKRESPALRDAVVRQYLAQVLGRPGPGLGCRVQGVGCRA